MSKSFILFLVLFPLVSLAQNWELIQEDEIYYYSRSDSSGVVNSMRIDSIYFQGQNQVYVLKDNFISKNDTCIENNEEVDSWEFEGNDPICEYFDLEKGSILGKEILELAEGEFHINSGERIIKTQASLFETWIYDSSTSIDATVTSIYLGDVLGIQDSIKEITLSDQFLEDIGLLKLSRNHGLIEFSFNDEIDFSLVELSSMGYGITTEQMEQSLSYDIGDILVYQLTMYGKNDWEYHGKVETRRFEIIGMDSSGINPAYVCNVAYERNIYDNEIGMDLFYSDTLMSYLFKPFEWYLPSFSLPGEIGKLKMKSPSFDLYVPIINLGTQNDFIGGDNLYSSSTFYEYPDLPWELYFENLLGSEEGDKFLFKGTYFQWNTYTPFNTFLSSSSIVLPSSVYALSPSPVDTYGMLFQEGKGLIQFGWYWFEMEMMIRMIGLKKGDEEFGIIPSVSEILSIKEQEEVNFKVEVYPNPFKAEINISSLSTNLEVRVYSVIGKELDIIFLDKGENRLDMSNYKGNAFIFKFISDKGITTKKVLRVNN